MPLTRPSAVPQPTPTGIASATPSGPKPATAVDIMPPTATTHGTDRSICPSRITTIAPVAITPRNEATLSCCSRYSGDRKLLEYRLPTSSSTTMQPNADTMAGSARRRSACHAETARMPVEAVPPTSAIEIEPVAHAQQAQRAQAHRGGQHHALEQRLPQRLEVEHEQQVADGAEHQ